MADDGTGPIRALSVAWAIRANFPTASVSSWFRSVAHNADVGGVPTSKHQSGEAVDVTYDDGVFPPLSSIQYLAKFYGCKVIREIDKNHDHIQTL